MVPVLRSVPADELDVVAELVEVPEMPSADELAELEDKLDEVLASE